MSLKYLKNKSGTPQTSPATPTQVKNNAGGFVFELNPFDMLNRFLVLGAESGTFYASQEKVFEGGVKCLEALCEREEDMVRMIDIIIDVSTTGKAPKNEPAIYALAYALSCDLNVRSSRHAGRLAAYRAIPQICRTGTDFLHLVQYVKSMRGFGRGLIRALSAWYNDKTPKDVAFQISKYAQRDGMSHKDVFRLCHVAKFIGPNNSPERQEVYKYIVDKLPEGVSKYRHLTNGACDLESEALKYLAGVEMLKEDIKDETLLEVVKAGKYPMEVIPSEKRSAAVYKSLIPTAGLGWLVRNLGNLSKHEVLTETSWDVQDAVIDRITNAEAIKYSRLHPIKILAANMTYANGKGTRGGGQWAVNRKVVDALDKAFYMSFGNVQPTGKRFMIGLDVSGSMDSGEVAGVPGLTPKMAGALLAMVTYRTEPYTVVKAFDHNLHDVPMGPNDTIQQMMRSVPRWGGGGTDCAKPMLWALENNADIDCFICITDNETWHGAIHPFEALDRYRKRRNPAAKLIVIGMTTSGFTIAKPGDPGMLDVVGMSTDVPELINLFVRN